MRPGRCGSIVRTPSAEKSMQRAKGLRIAGFAIVWLVTLFLAFVFVAQGFAKFSDSSGWAAAFRHWGYPDWFRVAIGVAEVGAALVLLVPATAPFGAAGII